MGTKSQSGEVQSDATATQVGVSEVVSGLTGPRLQFIPQGGLSGQGSQEIPTESLQKARKLKGCPLSERWALPRPRKTRMLVTIQGFRLKKTSSEKPKPETCATCGFELKPEKSLEEILLGH